MKKIHRLSLKQETIRTLTHVALGHARGALFQSEETICGPSVFCTVGCSGTCRCGTGND